MFSTIPHNSEGNYSHNLKYARVTKLISHHEWGQVEFCGRYYPAELQDPNDGEIPSGVRVRVYAERGAALVVGLDTSITLPRQIDPVHEVSSLTKIPVFPS